MEKTEIEEIKEITGTTENACKCNRCISFCKNRPCMGTPTDMLNLIKAGHENHLTPTVWAEGAHLGIPPITMFQIKFDNVRGCCSFLTDTNQCSLHNSGLKPTEGKLSTCKLTTIEDPSHPKLSINIAVGLTWTEDRNYDVLMQIINIMNERKQARRN